MYRFLCLSMGVIGPLRSEQITAPTTSIGAFLPESFFGWAVLACLPSAQSRQFFLNLSVSTMPLPGSLAMRSTSS
ncbi:hypothetical protein PHMEG_00035686 [Phytophthora megakarya]|uniref:Uncharacterized protein n=1 Tax=Phytophthora megakarya TaxID=4795 RepID=A0A225UQX3_9STRA|nr:hypothetical protein PHMEG_00035686 [Phytophthora megakarya]